MVSPNHAISHRTNEEDRTLAPSAPRTHSQLLPGAKLISSGVVEGLNNKAKVTMRRSYGFRTYRVLELALYHSLGKLPEPDSVAVGMLVSQHPPHRSPRAALPHEAPILDEWR